MTVGELRKALEGAPDDMDIAHRDESWWVIVSRAEIAQMKPRGEFDLGDLDECETGEPGKPAFLIS